ncbi:MAG: hypothetical protein JWP29_3533 [Rhodoferax sp.]|nr:hypothetical protein [Rhodoferax sp.]
MTGFSRFTKQWASTGSTLPATDTQSAAGFAYLGETPPSVELFNSMFQNLDDKDNWLYGQIAAVLAVAGITPADASPTQLRSAINFLITAQVNVEAASRASAFDYLNGVVNTKQANLGYTPVQQGTGAGQSTNAVKLGWNSTALLATIDNYALGRIWTDSLWRGSFGVNGYEVLPSGKIEQWGYYYPAGGASSQVGITFPLTFPTACDNVILTLNNSTTAIGGVAVYAQSQSGFAIGQNFSGGQSAPLGVFWRAIGR